MTKRERVVAALGGQPVDRPPVAFWRHAPDVDHTAKGLAEAMLAFHRRLRLRLAKGMSSSVYRRQDWGGPGAGTRPPRRRQQRLRHPVRDRGASAARPWPRPAR